MYQCVASCLVICYNGELSSSKSDGIEGKDIMKGLSRWLSGLNPR